MWLRGQQWQLGKDAKSTEGPASSSFERCTRILVTVLILAIVCVCAGQQLARFGGQPRRAVYKSFHGPQRSTEEINGEVKRQELMLSTKDTWNPKAARAAVQELVHLGKCGPSTHNNKYRSMICTIVRNDIHLREFIVRSLLQGFCHIVIYDNNQIEAGMDHSIKLLLEPFIQEGVVTPVPFMQSGTHFLHNQQKDQHVFECVNKYGSKADWVTVMDTDEYFYISKRPGAEKPSTSRRSIVSSGKQGSPDSSSSSSSSRSSMGILNSFLTDIEDSALEACAIKFPWRMMYGEHKVLQSDQLLLDTYPKVCASHTDYKVMFRPGRATPKPPHKAKCKYRHESEISVDDKVFYQALPQYDVKLLHYYSRSLEEYLVKTEQSMPPYVRWMRDSYDTVTGCMKLEFDQQYTAATHSILQRIQTAQGSVGNGGIALSASPEWQPMGRPDYALYMFIKLRVQQRHEWDESAYLMHNPAAAELVSQGKYVDGLHHFLVTGFKEGLTTYWVQEGSAERTCIA